MELAKARAPRMQSPAGGCLLTNKEYGRKAGDLSTTTAAWSWMPCVCLRRPPFPAQPSLRRSSARIITKPPALLPLFRRRRPTLVVKTKTSPPLARLRQTRRRPGDLAQLTARYGDLARERRRLILWRAKHRRLELPVTGIASSPTGSGLTKRKTRPVPVLPGFFFTLAFPSRHPLPKQRKPPNTITPISLYAWNEGGP